MLNNTTGLVGPVVNAQQEMKIKNATKRDVPRETFIFVGTGKPADSQTAEAIIKYYLK